MRPSARADARTRRSLKQPLARLVYDGQPDAAVAFYRELMAREVLG